MRDKFSLLHAGCKVTPLSLPVFYLQDRLIDIDMQTEVFIIMGLLQEKDLGGRDVMSIFDLHTRDGSHRDNLGENLRLCKLLSHSRRFLSKLKFFNSLGL
jgi:hypothetical protein